MRRSLGWLAGVLGLAGAYRALKRQPEPLPAPPDDGPDPRAEELRRRLEEAKPAVADREELEAGETPVDEAPDPAPALDPDAKRRNVHGRARAAIDDMQREPGDDA